MVELLPIITPQIDWNKYLSFAQQILGVSLSGGFDELKIPLSPKAFLISLNTLSQSETSDLDTPNLKHLTYTFLVVMLADSYYELTETAALAYTSSESTRPGIRLGVVTGTLLQWQQSVVCCSNSSNPDIREFGSKVKTYFDGVGDFWKHYLKTKLRDETLKLIHRPN